MQKCVKREILGRKRASRRRLLFFPKGIGLFKLAVGLLAIASVLFLVPGLRLLIPGLQDIGTTKLQAMPVEAPQDTVPSQPDKPATQDTQQPYKALNFGSDELGLADFFGGDNNALHSVSAKVQPERPSSDVIDMGDQMLNPQVSPYVFGTAAYKGLGPNTELSSRLVGGSRF